MAAKRPVRMAALRAIPCRLAFSRAGTAVCTPSNGWSIVPCGDQSFLFGPHNSSFFSACSFVHLIYLLLNSIGILMRHRCQLSLYSSRIRLNESSVGSRYSNFI